MGCCIRKINEEELLHTPPIEEKPREDQGEIGGINNGPAPVKAGYDYERKRRDGNGESNEGDEGGNQGESEMEHSKPLKDMPHSPYDERVLELINQVRINPKAYADLIEESIQYIQEEKGKLIYKQKVKVALCRGAEAFVEAVEFLRNLTSLPALHYKEEITVPIPEDEPSLKDPKYITQQVEEIQQKHNVNVFFKDLIKIPDVAVLLMVVDDNGKSSGKKRDAVFNKDFRYIGISNTTLNKIFTAFFTFST